MKIWEIVKLIFLKFYKMINIIRNVMYKKERVIKFMKLLCMLRKFVVCLLFCIERE